MLIRRVESRNGFKFGTFIGRFPSDRVASVAVEGLKPGSLQYSRRNREEYEPIPQ